MATKSPSYGAADIQVLEGLEAVRHRPGMYIGSTGPTGLHHLVWEVVDNSVDEAMAGHCTRIDVTLLPDGACQVSDDGRGIPVEPYTDPKYKGMSTAEVVLTVLHAGGKFGGGGYKVSGGLHGVGISVVNALSERLEVEIDRGGKHHFMDFAKGGKIQTKLKETGPAPRGRTGTLIRFWPDPTIMEEVTFRAQTMLERFQIMAFLNRGLEIRFNDQRPGHEAEPTTFKYTGGIIDFVKHVNRTKEALFSKVGYFEGNDEDSEVEVAFQWNTGFNADGLHSFANGISTIEGGVHEEGFRTALTGVVNRYARAKQLLKEKDENLAGEDIREGLTAIISVRLGNPQFEGQTKGKLGNTAMRSLVTKVTNDKLQQWFEENPTEANKMSRRPSPPPRRAWPPARRATSSATRRCSTARACPTSSRTARRRTPTSASCSSSRATPPAVPRCRPATRYSQAILPIRGKILNVERARLDKMLKNNEIQALISAIGAGVGEEFDVEKRALRQGHRPVRRRRRRQPHPHPAAHLLLPPDARPGRAGLHLHRPAAALLHRGGQGEGVPQGRCRQGRLPGRQAQPPQGLRPPQGPR